MVYDPTWAWALEVLYGVAALAAAGLVWFVASGKRANQWLATYLIVEGIGIGGILAGVSRFDLSAPTAAGIEAVLSFSYATTPYLYTFFVSRALPVPASRALRRRWVRTALLLAMAIHAYLLTFHWRVLLDAPYGVRVFVFVGPLVASATYGLVAAIQYYRQARGTAGPDRRAKAYLLAFAVRDGTYIAFYGFAIPVTAAQVTLADAWWNWWLVGLQLGWLAFLALLVPAILRGDILELDRKIASGTAGTGAAAALAFVFLVITEGLEAQAGVESTGLSVAVGAGLALLFRPLHHTLLRAIQARLPDARPMSAMDKESRHRIYTEQVHLFFEDGHLSEKERRVLSRLAERLGIDATTARRIEAKAVES